MTFIHNNNRIDETNTYLFDKINEIEKELRNTYYEKIKANQTRSRVKWIKMEEKYLLLLRSRKSQAVQTNYFQIV